MILKHQLAEPTIDNPFQHCKLDREKYALVLTDIVSRYADGFVLALNNEWGTGKTTFVNMWQKHLLSKDFQTIYFNAWENDFDGNPLVAIISELETIINKKNEKIFKSIIEKGAVLIKNVAPAIFKAIAKKYIDTEIITDAIENTTKATTEILEEEIKEYTSKKKTIIQFRKTLEEYIQKKDSSQPLIFIIDELDRCRPDYAVEVLEQMKHFFSVKGVVFVLSIDKSHLANSVCGFYGSEKINTDEYLRRFIDLEYSIPKPSTKNFTKYLFNYYNFNEFFSSPLRGQFREFQSDSQNFLLMAEMMFDKSNATLRQQEKIFGQIRLILSFFKANEYTFSHLLFVLSYIKTMKNELYQKIETNAISLQELSDAFTELMPSDKKNRDDFNFVYIEAHLLYFYNNTQEYKNRIKLFDEEKSENFIMPVKSKLEIEGTRSSLTQCFERIKQQWNYNETSLTYLLNKINLVDPIIIQ